MKFSKVYSVSDEEFRNIVSSSNSYSECLQKLGLKFRGGSSTDILKERIQELGCSVEHFIYPHDNEFRVYPLEDILVSNSSYHNVDRLKKRLVTSGLLEYKCAVCGISEWQGKTLSLQLDHINGINNDHRLQNLRLICPNCHSQTNTFAGKNKNK